MKRFVLFSTPSEIVREKLEKTLLPEEIKDKRVAYMPSDGADVKQKYIDEWREFVTERGATFVVVDNSVEEGVVSVEAKKIRDANVLIISGGNTFTLLRNLRRSGLDGVVKEFAEKDEFILAGFSAGAIVLTPTIAIAGIKGYDTNDVGITDLTGLGLLDFEVFAHYSDECKDRVALYENKTSNKIIKLTDNDVGVIDR